MADDVLFMSIASVGERLRTKSLSPVDLTVRCLRRAEKLDHRLHAYTRLLPDMAIRQAQVAESEIAKGCYKGALHGIPIAVKDLYDIGGIPTTASSRVRQDWVPSSDSFVIRKLKQAGAIIIGKTNTHEFAYGGSTPPTRNPWDTRCTPGGSSGGSAVAVASGSVFMAMGTDTAGSVRIPSALCGVSGFKPTFGYISRTGITPLSWSLDHPGPITRSIQDAAICMGTLAGRDAGDPTTLSLPTPSFKVAGGGHLTGMRLGVPQNYFFDGVSKEAANSVQEACSVLETMGAQLIEVTIPYPEQIVPAHFTIMMAEASAYHQSTLSSVPELYGADVRMLLQAGATIRATDYIHACRVRGVMKNSMSMHLRDIDAIVAPSVPASALATADSQDPKENLAAVPSEMIDNTRLTLFANLFGLPAAALPCGFDAKGLPLSVQIIGKPTRDDTVLTVGAAYQGATGWHTKHPL